MAGGHKGRPVGGFAPLRGGTVRSDACLQLLDLHLRIRNPSVRNPVDCARDMISRALCTVSWRAHQECHWLCVDMQTIDHQLNGSPGFCTRQPCRVAHAAFCSSKQSLKAARQRYAGSYLCLRGRELLCER